MRSKIEPTKLNRPINKATNSRLFSRLAVVCDEIGDASAEADGFVPIRNLLSQFHATLELRPLLVEGMLASEYTNDTESEMSSRWVVLVDQDMYSINKTDLATESADNPLPARFRNTIAHELAHSIAFRPSQFHVDLQLPLQVKSQQALLEMIERETEKLSPLLLWPRKAIAAASKSRSRALDATELASIRRRAGISRYVLINRLKMLPAVDSYGLREHRSLKNLGLVLGEWSTSHTTVLRKWPIFSNFERQIVPRFLLRILFDRSDRTPARELFDVDFVLTGGAEYQAVFETTGGIAEAPDAERMRVEITVERTSRKPGTQFLVAVVGEILRG